MEKVSDNLEKPSGRRLSGVDLLKIIALLLICISHANQTMRNLFNFQTFGITNGLTIFFAPFGTIGNYLFVICSSYFLVDKTKTRNEKVLNILFDSTLISIIILICFLISGASLNYETIIHQFLPDIFALNWFIPCYIIFYLFAPITVFGLKHLSPKEHLGFVIGIIIVYGGLSILGLKPIGSYLLEFFFILIVVAFIKWYRPDFYKSKKKNLVVFFVGMIFAYSLYIGFLFLTTRNLFFSRFSFMSIYSPLLLIPLIALANVFIGMKFSNKFISCLGRCTLFVYVIHDNDLLSNVLRVKYFNWVMSAFDERLAVIYIVLCGIFMFVAGFVLAVIYNETLHKITTWLANKCNRLINKLLSFFSKRIIRE